ncbi:hypothetical protein HK102_010718, partial [Quaeritorhiza haematococci]
DERFDGSEIVEWFNPNEHLFHSKQKGQFPVSGRDICGLQATVYDAPRSTTYLLATSVTDPLVPTDSKRVRADLGIAGWIIKADKSDSKTTITVTYIVKIDAKGSIPSALIRLLSTQTPLCIASVRSYLESYGVPPTVKILGNTGEGLKCSLKSEAFTHKTGTLDFEYHIEAAPGDSVQRNVTGLAGLVEVNIDPKMYPFGADIRITPQPNQVDLLDVKISPDKTKLRFYTRYDAVAAKVQKAASVPFAVKIAKRGSSVSPMFLVNGKAEYVTADRSNKLVMPGAGQRRKSTVKPLDAPVPKQEVASVPAPVTVPAAAQPQVSRAAPAVAPAAPQAYVQSTATASTTNKVQSNTPAIAAAASTAAPGLRLQTTASSSERRESTLTTPITPVTRRNTSATAPTTQPPNSTLVTFFIIVLAIIQPVLNVLGGTIQKLDKLTRNQLVRLSPWQVTLLVSVITILIGVSIQVLATVTADA